jgi:hypothetical protein
MSTNKGCKFLSHLLVLATLVAVAAAQEARTVHPVGNTVIWEQVDIPSRDTYWGPGGQAMFPVMKGAKYVDRQTGGYSLKFIIEDGERHRWIAKDGSESQAEVAATRLLWAIGYKTEVDYLIPKVTLPTFGTRTNVRFEARPDGIKRGDRWSWMDNPFLGSRELAGLKIMMSLINNWDLKDENTVTLVRDGRVEYIVSDLGASFGKLADKSMSRSGRTVNDPEGYAKANFIKGTDGGMLLLDYRGINEDVVKGIKVEDARWVADLLLQLSDKQITDAFRAANYKPEEIALYTQAVKARIAALDKAAQLGQTAEN